MNLPQFKSKKLSKTQSDLQYKAFDVVKKLILHKGYIKGFGSKDRVMTGDHSPIENIEKKITAVLKDNSLIENEGLILIPSAKMKLIFKQTDIEIL